MAGTTQPIYSFACTSKVDFSKRINEASLKDKSVLVTGGANGIGAGFVTALAGAGAYVTIADINEESGHEIAQRLTHQGLHVQFISTDVASFSSQTYAFKAAIAFSPNFAIDIVIACAGLNGVSILRWLTKSAEEDVDPLPPNPQVIDVSLTGTFYTTHLVLHYFRKTSATSSNWHLAPSKQLIFVGSLASYITLPHLSDYQAAKFGVRGLWKSIRGNQGILGESRPSFRKNLIAPTFIRTNMTAKMEELLGQLWIKMADVEDCAQDC